MIDYRTMNGEEIGLSPDFQQQTRALYTGIEKLIKERGTDGILNLPNVSTLLLFDGVEIDLQKLLTPTIPDSVSLNLQALENGSYCITFGHNGTQKTEIDVIIGADRLTILDKKDLGRVVTPTIETIHGLNKIIINLDSITDTGTS